MVEVESRHARHFREILLAAPAFAYATEHRTLLRLLQVLGLPLLPFFQKLPVPALYHAVHVTAYMPCQILVQAYHHRTLIPHISKQCNFNIFHQYQIIVTKK